MKHPLKHQYQATQGHSVTDCVSGFNIAVLTLQSLVMANVPGVGKFEPAILLRVHPDFLEVDKENLNLDK